MKTTSLVKGVAEDKIPTKTIDENKGVVLGTRRLLQPLQKAAGDKENLVGGGRLSQEQMPPSKEKYPSSSRNKDGTPSKKKSAKSYDKKTITVEDLTSEESPGVAYWEELCEKQRSALAEALSENESLHKRVAGLEEENQHCKLLLDETRAIIDTLNEIINEKDEEEE